MKKLIVFLGMLTIVLTQTTCKDKDKDKETPVTTYDSVALVYIYTSDNMVLVKGGTFTMGCTSEQESDCSSNEKPTHSVTLSDFYIGKYEVTQAQWNEVMDSNPSDFVGDSLPVEMVSWADVQDFITQ
jgi:formylglycine-generating enzyme required for sulfatase activity